MKSVTMVDRRDEIEALRKELDQLSVTVKSNNFKGTKPRKDRKDLPSGSKLSSPWKKEDPRRNLKGPATMSAGPFKPGQSNFQCHKCRGWGHGRRECAMKGNVDWARIHGESEPKKTETVPKKDQQ